MVDVLLGLQWGDEGKGKIVDVLCKQYDTIARFQGGPNAGHTLIFDGKKHVLNTIPSGIFHPNTHNLIGNGVVIDPTILVKELAKLQESGIDPFGNEQLLISRKAHVIIPTHKLLDAANEQKMGAAKIGSTLKGISPTYMDKIGRNGIRIGDLISDNFTNKYNTLKNKHLDLLKNYDFQFDLDTLEQEFLAAVEILKKVTTVDGEYFVNEKLDNNLKVLAEGAQGTLLDIDFGSYPFVTSSNTTTAGACTGLGIAPSKIGRVIGIFKAYCTRVGSGPFPTELDNDLGELIRQKGGEFGATTGRARRCGWLDIPALRYAIMLNGVTDLVMTKADVLTGFDTINVCTGYKINGVVTQNLPFDICNEIIEPVYESHPCWKTDFMNTKTFDALPIELINYVNYLEKVLKVKITYVSTGPDRVQTIVRN